MQLGCVFAVPALVLLPLYSARKRSWGVWYMLVTALVRGLRVLAVLGVSGMVLDGFTSAKIHSQEVRCMSNVKQLSMAVLLYSQDWGETFPPASSWGTLAGTRFPPGTSLNLFRCPSADSPYGYAFNRYLNRVNLDELEDIPSSPSAVE